MANNSLPQGGYKPGGYRPGGNASNIRRMEVPTTYSDQVFWNPGEKVPKE